MSKKYLLLSLLYATQIISTQVTNTETAELETAELGTVELQEYMTIDIPGLSALDGTHLINISKMHDFQNKTEKLVHFKVKTKTNEYTLEELVQLVESGKLSTEQEKKLFDMYIKQFMQISHNYFNDIRHLKPILVKIISLWANQRERTDSTTLLWAQIEPGKEEEFARDFPAKLKEFYTFLMDVDMLLQDLMHSCPKSYARYLECKKIVEEKHQSHG